MVLSAPDSRKVQAYYEANPLMVSSPFGGVDGINADLMRAVFDRLNVQVDGRRVLDVGCGRGYTREVVKAAGGAYYGADFVTSGSGFRLIRADAQRLPFPDASFDAVFCIDAFEHFPNPDASASEFARVLRPGGFVFLSVPNYGNVAGLVKWRCETFGRYEKNTWAPFRHWQAQELETFLTTGKVRRVFRGAGFNRFTHKGHAAEAVLGLFPWNDHARMIEAIQFRMQRLFERIGPAVVRLCPSVSLHGFWKIER